MIVFKYPIIIFLLLSTIFRWVFIIGIGDWPDDLTFSAYDRNGHILFKDYYFGYLNPIIFKCINFIILFSLENKFLILNFAIWLLWLLNILLSFSIIDKLELSLKKSEIILFTISILIFYNPINTNFIFFNFFSNFLMLLHILIILSYLESSKSFFYITILSFFCALNILVKVNIGIILLIITSIVLILKNYQISKKIYLIFFELTTLIILTIFFSFLTIFYFYPNSVIEIINLIFFAPSLEKGNLFSMFFRSLPRISLNLFEKKYFYEVVLMYLILAPLLFLIFQKSDIYKKKFDFFINYKLLLIFYIFLLIFSIFNLDTLNLNLYLTNKFKLISIPEFNNHLFYSVSYISLVFMMFKKLQINNYKLNNFSFFDYKFLFIGISTLLILKSLGAGGRYSGVYAAPLICIFVIHLINQKLINRYLSFLLIFFGFFYLFSWNFFPNHPSTFTKFQKIKLTDGMISLYLPESKNAINLKNYHRNPSIFDDLGEFLNLNNDKKILWMNGGYPSFFNEKLYTVTIVPSSPPHNSKNLKIFEDSLQSNLPDIIILDNPDNWDWDNKKRYTDSYFKFENFDKWLNLNYDFTKIFNEKNFKLMIYEKK